MEKLTCLARCRCFVNAPCLHCIIWCKLLPTTLKPQRLPVMGQVEQRQAGRDFGGGPSSSTFGLLEHRWCGACVRAYRTGLAFTLWRTHVRSTLRKASAARQLPRRGSWQERLSAGTIRLLRVQQTNHQEQRSGAAGCAVTSPAGRFPGRMNRFTKVMGLSGRGGSEPRTPPPPFFTAAAFAQHARYSVRKANEPTRGANKDAGRAALPAPRGLGCC